MRVVGCREGRLVMKHESLKTVSTETAAKLILMLVGRADEEDMLKVARRRFADEIEFKFRDVLHQIEREYHGVTVTLTSNRFATKNALAIAIRRAANITLREAVQLVKQTPAVIAEGISPVEARRIKAEI